MSRYIDEDKAKNGVMEFVDEHGEIVGMFVNDFNILLERCAVDVEEVKHGKWIVKHGVLAGDGIYGDMGECSVCGLHLRNYEWDYCPNCGALMVSKDE